MKSWDATLLLEMAKEAASSHILVECEFSTTLRVCDGDVPIYSGGNEFSAWPVEIGQIEYSDGMGVDSVTVELGTVDKSLTAIVLGEDVANDTVTIYFTCLGTDGQPIATETIFAGLITEWELTEEVLKIKVASEMIKWQKKTIRTCQATCRWAFKGTECGYSGEGTWCDKSYEKCFNKDNYGGFRFLPSIKDKKVLWGRSPE